MKVGYVCMYKYKIYLLGWNHIIKVAAIDCAEARNTRTCEHFNIQGYPTLKVSVKDYMSISCCSFVTTFSEQMELCF